MDGQINYETMNEMSSCDGTAAEEGKWGDFR